MSDDGSRILFNSFAGDSAREIFAYLGIEGASEYRPSRAEIAAGRRIREAEARKLELEKLTFCSETWAGGEDMEGSPAARYLWNRGLVLDCPDIAYHPAAPRHVPWNRMDGDPPPPEPSPALICMARNGRGEPRGLHLTYVTSDGLKAFGDWSRLMMGPMAGAALRTAPISADGTLAVGEGLESCGAYALLHGVPTWATFSTSGLKAFEVPYSVRKLIIAADNDENGAGLAAAMALAERARGRCDVVIEEPTIIGDWNDVLMGDRDV